MQEENNGNLVLSAKNLKLLRKNLGFNQKEMGDKIGISPQTLSGIERGDSKLTQDQLVMLGENLDVNLNWLLRGIGKPTMAEEAEEVDDNFANEVLRYMGECELKFQGAFQRLERLEHFLGPQGK